MSHVFTVGLGVSGYDALGVSIVEDGGYRWTLFVRHDDGREIPTCEAIATGDSDTYDSAIVDACCAHLRRCGIELERSGGAWWSPHLDAMLARADHGWIRSPALKSTEGGAS